jgi:hypothetical protein
MTNLLNPNGTSKNALQNDKYESILKQAGDKKFTVNKNNHS